MARVSAKSWREVCEKTHGNKSAIARHFDKSRQWVYDQLQKPKYKDIYEASKEVAIDVVEGQLMRHIVDDKDEKFKGEPWAIKFYLQTIGKTRGWTSRVELTGADGESLLGITLDEDVQEILAQMGIPAEVMASQASAQFNELIRRQAEKSNIKIKK